MAVPQKGFPQKASTLNWSNLNNLKQCFEDFCSDFRCHQLQNLLKVNSYVDREQPANLHHASCGPYQQTAAKGYCWADGTKQSPVAGRSPAQEAGKLMLMRKIESLAECRNAEEACVIGQEAAVTVLALWHTVLEIPYNIRWTRQAHAL